MEIPYTICFCIKGNKVLLIYRNNPPNQYKWNGIGGKIEKNEDFQDAVKREIFEEAEFTVSDEQLAYVGIVRWHTVQDAQNKDKGMYAFTARLPEASVVWDELDTREGLLVWKNLEWVCDKNNKKVVDNIPYFLPLMLKTKKPLEYFCEYRDKKFVKLVIKDLKITD
jgi:8-oxo-dGTP diphosphatase